jgi:DNA-3-methyladenine glycosylase
MTSNLNVSTPEVAPAATTDLTLLGFHFFSQPATVVSAQLLGTIMARRIDGLLRRARVVETEAYVGPNDLASHASKGRTRRTEVMFGPAGRAYVYFIYGVHWMFNVVVGETGRAEAVLVRAAEPLDGWAADLTGPARLARAFNVTGADNGTDLTEGAPEAGRVHFLPDPAYRPRIIRAKRVGVDYARHWKDRLLRFIDANSPVAAKLRY